MDDGNKPALPWGVRIVSVFLVAVAVIMILPLALAGLNCFFMLTAAAHDSGGALPALGFGFLSLLLFAFLLFLCLGAGWLDQYIRGSHGTRFLTGQGDFLFAVVRPVVISLALYSTYAVVVGICAKFFLESGSYTWILAWSAVSGASIGAYARWCRGG